MQTSWNTTLHTIHAHFITPSPSVLVGLYLSHRHTHLMREWGLVSSTLALHLLWIILRSWLMRVVLWISFLFLTRERGCYLMRSRDSWEVYTKLTETDWALETSQLRDHVVSGPLRPWWKLQVECYWPCLHHQGGGAESFSQRLQGTSWLSRVHSWSSWLSNPEL